MKAEIIRSFEEGAEQAGDILAGGKERRAIRIGLLTCGYFEYWRMYPNLREKVGRDLQTVEKRIASAYPGAVLSGMVDTLDTAYAAGRKFREKQVTLFYSFTEPILPIT